MTLSYLALVACRKSRAIFQCVYLSQCFMYACHIVLTGELCLVHCINPELAGSQNWLRSRIAWKLVKTDLRDPQKDVEMICKYFWRSQIIQALARNEDAQGTEPKEWLKYVLEDLKQLLKMCFYTVTQRTWRRGPIGRNKIGHLSQKIVGKSKEKSNL